MIDKKRRGRPAGTDYKEDQIALALVADRIIAEPTLRPMTAMKAVFDAKIWKGRGDQQRDTTVARWLKKWQTQGQAALEAARQRQYRYDRSLAAVALGQNQTLQAMRRWAAASEVAGKLCSPGLLKAMSAAAQSPFAREISVFSLPNTASARAVVALAELARQLSEASSASRRWKLLGSSDEP